MMLSLVGCLCRNDSPNGAILGARRSRKRSQSLEGECLFLPTVVLLCRSALLFHDA